MTGSAWDRIATNRCAEARADPRINEGRSWHQSALRRCGAAALRRCGAG
jgi:hypothetical protein